MNLHVVGFIPPVIGVEDEFNTFRLGGFYQKRLSIGSQVYLLNEKEKMIFGRAQVENIDVGDLGGADDAADLQVALGARAGPDANRMVSELHVHRVDIGFGVNSDRFDVEFTASANDAEGDFATVGNQDAFEHDGSKGNR